MDNDDFPRSLPRETRERLLEVRRSAAEQLGPLAAAGSEGRVNRPLIKALADLGILPTIFEGPVSATTLCALREGLAGGSTAAETAFALQGLGAYPIHQSGS